jgi:hypothetical protein
MQRGGAVVGYTASLEMIADRLDRETADRPDRKGDQRHDSERAPATRVERFFRQARRDKAGDVNLLPVGIGARLVEPVQRMLVRGLRKAPLTLQLLVRAELARQRIVAVWIAVRQVARNGPSSERMRALSTLTDGASSCM